MAITSPTVLVRYAVSRRWGITPNQQEGRLIMMDMIAFALVAVALALPGLITVLMSIEIHAEQARPSAYAGTALKHSLSAEAEAAN